VNSPTAAENAPAPSEDDLDCVALTAALPERVLDQLSGVLWLLSPSGVLLEDALCLHGGDLAPGVVRATLYVAPQEAGQAAQTLKAQAELLGVQVDVTATGVERQDWNRVWKKFYQPLTVGDRVRVEPAWQQGPEQPGLIRIAIDPGMAFGTGTHETTQLCMGAVVRWMDAQKAANRDTQAQRMLDAGTGSAILAILAVKMGLGGAVGTEIDAAALRTAQVNLALNGVESAITLLHTGDPKSAGPEQFPLVTANILASVLVPLRDAIVDRLAPGGTLVLSGILGRDGQEVADHYTELGLTLLRRDDQAAWVALTLERPL
jgi:ribosomal protein L11 methyltransferase